MAHSTDRDAHPRSPSPASDIGAIALEPIPLEPIASHLSHLSHRSRHSLHARFALDPESGPDHESDREPESDDKHPRPVVDIEHAPVDDDPRAWSARKKAFVLGLMTVAVLGPMISPSIYNPVLDEVAVDLGASQTQIGLSLSLFQGGIPLVWVTIAEIVGRKPVYIASFVLYTAGSAGGSRATSMPVLIGMRILQAVGSSAVVSSGAGSLADMYEIKERGRRLGWFYGMPMLGPTLGPLIGGALGNAYGWRSTMYFLAVFAFLMTAAFCFFPDTWRRERSRVYQKAIAAALRRQLKAQAVAEKREAKRERKRAAGLASTATTPAATNPPTPGDMTPARSDSDGGYDAEAARASSPGWWTRLRACLGLKPSDELRPSFVDLNPLPSTISVFRSPTNTAVLTASGLLFAVQYTTTYTASVTFARAPYSYNPLIIGVVLVSFGMGNVVGTIVGGRWSDFALRRLAARNGGRTEPEMRLQCTLPAMPILLAAYLIYAWTAHYTVHIAGPVVGLFLAGFALLFVYSSTLAYLVDSNPGRSASAVACNSFVRGAVACVMSQVAIPIQNGIGDGGLYTLFTGVLALSCVLLVVVAYKGKGWREAREARKEARSAAASAAGSGAVSGVVSGAASRSRRGGTNTPRPEASPASTAVGEEKGGAGEEKEGA